MGFLDPTTDFRFILPTETDANSPLSEELMSQYRENIESNLMDTKYSGKRFEIVSVDSDVQLTVQKVDSGDPDWAANELVLLVASMQSGLALGNNYDIATNGELNSVSTTATLTFTGSTLLTDGVQAGDVGLIMYSFSGQAHTHDGLDSPAIGAEDIFRTETGTVSYGRYISQTNEFSTTVYSRSTALRYYAIPTITIPSAGRGARDMNGWEFTMIVKAGTYMYFDDEGNYQTYTIATDVRGDTFTLETGVTDETDGDVSVMLTNSLYYISTQLAGVPINAPVEVALEIVTQPTGYDPVLSTANIELMWIALP